MKDLKLISSNLLVYGATHALVDAACVAIIFAAFFAKSLDAAGLVWAILLYNIIAFGAQPILGWISDSFKVPRGFAIIGCIIVALGVCLVSVAAMPAILIAGLGNAFFHVGGGTISLNLTPKKASAPGIFVAPGALGLFIGALIANNGLFFPLAFVLAFAVACVAMFVIKKPKLNLKPLTPKSNIFFVVLLLILLSVVIRALVGSVVAFPWKTDFVLLIALTLAVVFGKAFGGVLADKLGWIRVATIGLIVSAPLLYFGPSFALVGLFGMLIFNFTMPVTLVAVSNSLPGRPGFSFGLTTLALLLGALLAFFPSKAFFVAPEIIFVVIIISAACVYFGLRLYSRRDKDRSFS